MYPFLQRTVSRVEIVISEDQLIRRSQDMLGKSQTMLALLRADVFLGRQHYDPIPLPYELEE